MEDDKNFQDQPVPEKSQPSPATQQLQISHGDLIVALSQLLDLSGKSKPVLHREGLSLDDQCDQIRFYSVSASTINRSLALAGIAIIWIFKKPENHEILQKVLNWPLFFLGFSLTLDLIQYFYGAISYRLFYATQLKKLKSSLLSLEESSNMAIPRYIRLVIDILFYVKIIAMIVAYFLIISYLVNKL